MSRVALFVSLLLCLASQIVAQAPPQKKSRVATSAHCTRANAIDNTKQQILFTRTFDQAVPRIAVLLRAADLLWPHDPEPSMAAFMEAFDLAVQNYKEHGDQTKRASEKQFAAVIALPDQRFKVISTLARRDPAKARKLSEQILDEAAREGAANPDSQRKTAEKLLLLAHGLAPTDPGAAVSFARQSLRYPATLQLTTFLYHLARTNRTAADSFYQEALAAYGVSPMEQFLYLSAYPFGNTRDAGEMPGRTTYAVPEGYVASQYLQRLFVQRLLARAEVGLENDQRGPRFSDPSQMWLALNRLEKQIQTSIPDLYDPVIQTRDRLFTLLVPATQYRVRNIRAGDDRRKRSFDEIVDETEKQADPEIRDRDILFAVNGFSNDQPVERVVSVIDKVSDSNLRAGLLNWFYFFRTQALIKNKNWDEARKLAPKVVELDQRAYLFSRIAEELLKESEDQTQVRELLNEIAGAAAKAPKTITTARALLALANLYAKIDVNRGIEELGNAVKAINAIESPDFSLQFVMMKLEAKTFGSYAPLATPGFNPENAFREMGKVDFDSSLTQAAAFTDKSLRALTTLAVIEPCLEVTPNQKLKK